MTPEEKIKQLMAFNPEILMMNFPPGDRLFAAKYDQVFETERWMRAIPFIPFKGDWEVKIVPPHTMATARFLVKQKEGENVVSVYLDCYDNLGWFGSPYWEVYPIRGDTFRCAMEDVEALVEAIQDGLDNPGERHDFAETMQKLRDYTVEIKKANAETDIQNDGSEERNRTNPEEP